MDNHEQDNNNNNELGEENAIAENSDSSYEWVYYDVEECKSCSSDSNDMYGENGMNGFLDGEYEYYDEMTAEEEDEDED